MDDECCDASPLLVVSENNSDEQASGLQVGLAWRLFFSAMLYRERSFFPNAERDGHSLIPSSMFLVCTKYETVIHSGSVNPLHPTALESYLRSQWSERRVHANSHMNLKTFRYIHTFLVRRSCLVFPIPE